MAAHSKIGASSMHRWANCPGSVALCADLPDSTSAYAEEGTRAHELMEKWLGAALNRKEFVLSEYPFEMVENVQPLVESVIDEIKESNDHGDRCFVEKKFDMSAVYPGCYGTADIVFYDASEQLLKIRDLKYGAGIAVEVFEDGKPNEQLMYYALGTLATLPELKVKTVELGVYQPRCEHPDGPDRRHRLSVVELIDFTEDLIAAAKRTEDPNAPTIPGDWCFFCKAKAVCPSLQKQANLAAQDAFAPALPYDPQKLSDNLKMIPQIKAWIEGVHQFAYAEAMRGNAPPGYKLVEKRASRKWINPEEAQIALLTTKFSLNYETAMTLPELKSPAQIEKLIKKELKKDLASLVVSVSSGLTLAPVTDKRPEITKDAASAFADDIPLLTSESTD